MTKQPKRIWIDADHGKHPGDWSFSTEEHISAKDHRKMGRLPYVPEAAVSEDAIAAIERAAYERGKAEAQVQGDTFYILEWMAGARPPVHPNPMRGRQSFRTPKEAIAFFKRQASDAQFLSLTKRVFLTEDCTPQALALLTQEGR